MTILHNNVDINLNVYSLDDYFYIFLSLIDLFISLTVFLTIQIRLFFLVPSFVNLNLQIFLFIILFISQYLNLSIHHSFYLSISLYLPLFLSYIPYLSFSLSFTIYLPMDTFFPSRVIFCFVKLLTAETIAGSSLL